MWNAIYIRFYEHTHMHRIGWLVGWVGWMDGWIIAMIPGYHVRDTKSRYYS